MTIFHSLQKKKKLFSTKITWSLDLFIWKTYVIKKKKKVNCHFRGVLDWVALGWHCSWWYCDIDQPQYKCLPSFSFTIFFYFFVHVWHCGWSMSPTTMSPKYYLYWIKILRDYFIKQNLEDFKRFCEIILILLDFKSFFLNTLYNQDFENGFIIEIF